MNKEELNQYIEDFLINLFALDLYMNQLRGLDDDIYWILKFSLQNFLDNIEGFYFKINTNSSRGKKVKRQSKMSRKDESLGAKRSARGEKPVKYGRKARPKIKKVMDEWKEGTLHSGSKKGPKVKSQKQAIAIALSEARKKGFKIPKKRKRG